MSETESQGAPIQNMVTLTKHHGLGNDFLIAVDPLIPSGRSIGPADARRWCDRRRGIGADGLILATPTPDTPPGSYTMVLWNSDGSRAELSGNGLRCLGQALQAYTGLDTFAITTDAGPRTVSTLDAPRSEVQVRVTMGRATDGPVGWDGWSSHGVDIKDQLGVDMGNPHLVALVDDPTAIDLATVGRAAEAAYPTGVNVEIISVSDRQHLDLRVWERGAGITEACGSGACAAAVAAQRWGLVDAEVEVSMPGGSARVVVENGLIELIGPASFVAVVEVPLS